MRETTLYMRGNSTFFRLNVSVHFAVTSGRPGRPGGVQREEGVGGGADAVVGHCLQQAGGLRQGALLLVVLVVMMMMMVLLLLQLLHLLLMLLLLLLLLGEHLLVPTFRATTHLGADAQQPNHAEERHSNVETRRPRWLLHARGLKLIEAPGASTTHITDFAASFSSSFPLEAPRSSTRAYFRARDLSRSGRNRRNPLRGFDPSRRDFVERLLGCCWQCDRSPLSAAQVSVRL